MPELLNVLILEDNLADAKLLIYELQNAGFEPDWRRVETESDYLTTLEQTTDPDFVPGVILADYSLPKFNAVQALRLLQEQGLDIPFIVVTGSIDEEVVVACIRQGAADYLLKDRLTRLGSAVKQALAQKALRDEQHQAQAALRASEERFRRAITSISDHIYMTEVTETGDRHNLYLSPNVEALTGYPSKKFMADWRFWSWTVIHPEDRLTAAAQAAQLSEGRNSETEYRLVRADGEVIWVRDSARVEHVGNSKFIYGVVSDLTDRKQLEEQLYQAQKMEAIGRLAGGIAHDFNNILTVITGVSELLLQRQVSDIESMRQDIEQISESGERAAALTQQLLAFSRKQMLQPKILDLNSVVNNIDNMLRRLIGEDIELRTKLEPGLGQVKADPGQLNQVIMNLAVNARDAMPRGGQLTIETANVELDETYARHRVGVTAGAYVLLAMSDTGQGMDAATQTRIFEPFFTTKEQGRGSGLGLAVVHGIINQSNGHIWVYSEPERGTAFKIYLPRVDETPQTTTENVPAEPARGSETILLVEDETMVRNLIERSLIHNGYTVLAARQGREALQIAQEYAEPIHLLITDVILPEGMSGRDMAEQLAVLRPAIKILYISGYTDDAIVHHGVLDSDKAFLGKPFTPSKLAAKVRELLDA